MMGTKIRSFEPLPPDVSLEELVPESNFYRRLEERLDLSFARELVRPLYAKAGRLSVDPEVFFELQLVMFFENMRSERQLMRAVADRLSVRWYLATYTNPCPTTPASPGSGTRSLPKLLLGDRGAVRRGWAGVGRGALLRRDQDRGQRLSGVDHALLRRRAAPPLPLRGHPTRRRAGPHDPNGAPAGAPRAAVVEDLDSLPTSEDAEQLICANAAKND